MSENGHLVVTWDEFMAERAPSVPSIWGDALLVKGGGYTLLGGDTGVGKTILIANLLLHLADARESFLGFDLPGRVVSSLILEAEGSRYKFRDWIAHIAASLGIRPSPAISFHQRNAELVIGDALESMLAESKAEVAFLDTIGRFWSGNENDATEWRAGVTSPLAKLATGLDVAFLFGDHYNKPNEMRHGSHKVRGTPAKVQDCGATMRLEIGKGGRSSRILTIDRVRDGAQPDPDRRAVLIDLQAGTVAIDEAPDALDTTPTRDARCTDVQALVAAGQATTAEIKAGLSAQLHIGDTQAENLIASTIEAGMIERVRKGLYRLPGAIL